jgi:photosystem II stability/assembly factor-like uncharacterized protein
MGAPGAGATRLAATAPAHDVIYAAVRSAHMYRSDDGGKTWQEADHGLPSGGEIEISSPVVALDDSNIIYAGTVSDGPTGGAMGVYRSADGGAHWQADNGDSATLASAEIDDLAVDPLDHQTVYAATDDGALLRTADGGRHWLALKQPSGANFDEHIALNPFAPANLVVCGLGGMFRSTNQGATWTKVASGVSAACDLSFGAGRAYDVNNGEVYRTSDGGKTWQATAKIKNGVYLVTADPQNGASALTTTSDGRIYRSSDSGVHWTQTGYVGDQVTALTFDPARPGRVVAGTASGAAYLSDDGGATWSSAGTPFAAPPNLANPYKLPQTVALVAAAPPLPTYPVPAPTGAPAPGTRYFPQTHHLVSDAFLSFYQANGGIQIFGLPLSEVFTEAGQQVQYFERVRLVNDHGHVSITPLGAQLTAGRHFPPLPGPGGAGSRWFPDTKHTLSGLFLAFWQAHRGSVLFGSPISQPLYEQNGDGTGRTYLVQYCQNVRLEYHPEAAGTTYVVTLGQLGRQALRQRGWL